jgi:putative flippase GtrA
VRTATAAPIRKVAVGALASAIAVLVIWLLTMFAHVSIDATVAGAIAAVVYAVIAYLVPPAAQDAPVPVYEPPAPGPGIG